MKRCILSYIILTVCCSSIAAESLWEEDFNGYGTGKKPLEPGRIVTVIIDTDTQIAFSSTSSGERELVLSFSGGETGNLFSFLPEVQSKERGNIEGEEEISLSTSIAARVQETNAAGMSYIQGSRTTIMKNKVQALTVSGWCSSRQVDSRGIVKFNHLADGQLTYRTLLEPENAILTEEDIVSALSDGGTVPGTPEGPAAAGDTPDADTDTGPAGETEESVPGGTDTPALYLRDERKKELLLQYLNQFVDIIFTDQ